MMPLNPRASPVQKVAGIVRMIEWWEHRLTCFLGIAYGVAYFERLPFALLLPLALLIIMAAFSCAAFVSVINEITDQEADARAGKPNSMQGRSTLFKAGIVVACLTAGGVVGWFMRDYPVSLAIFALNWAVFVLYSVPPIRLKGRGMCGALADAIGERVLPTLLMASLMAESVGRTMGWSLAAPLILWSFAFGLYIILEHQVEDCENDRLAGINTVATRHGTDWTCRLIVRVIYPIEVLGLLWLLIVLNVPLTWPLLALCLLFETRRGKFARLLASWREPAPGFWLPLTEYYKVYLPATFLIALAWDQPVMLLLVGFHLVLFPYCNLQALYALASFVLAPFRGGFAAWHAGTPTDRWSVSWNRTS